MKAEDLKPGTWVKFKRVLTEKSGWAKGEIAMVKEHDAKRSEVEIISAADPKKRDRFGKGGLGWFEDAPAGNPFEQGPSAVAALPDRERWTPSVTDHDMLLDP